MQIVVQAPRPFGPAEVLAFANDRGGALFRHFAAQFNLPQLGVGHQAAINKQRRANAGAEGQDHHQARAATPGAEAHLGQSGGVGVIEHRDWAAHRLPEQLGDGLADPILGDVDRGQRPAMPHRSRKSTPDRPRPAKMPDQLRHHLAHGLGLGPLGRRDTQPFGSHVAGSRVHRRALDTGSTDVDAKNLHSRPPVATLSRAAIYWAVQPPSITSSLPVTNDDSSLAR